MSDLLSDTLKGLAFFAALGVIALVVWFFYGRHVGDDSIARQPVTSPFVCEERMPAIVCAHIDDRFCVDAYVTYGIRGDDLSFFCK